MSTVQQFEAKLVVNCNNGLGECPLYDDRKGLICWIDIDNCKFWEYNPKTKQNKSYSLPERPGAFALCQKSSNYYLFAFENGPLFYNINTNTILGKRIFLFEPHLKTRINDSRCDKNGRFIVGGYAEYDKRYPETKYNPISNIYRINTDGSLQVLLKNIACTNSICFNNDNNKYKMYITDSRCWNPKQIREYKYYNDNRLPSNPRIFTQWNEEKCNISGGIDGSIIDNDGYLWNAEFNGGRVVRYDNNGKINMIVNVPEPYVTCCCFGGTDLDILYITTCGNRLTKQQKNNLNGICGALYAVKLPVKGRLEDRFGGTPYSCNCLSSIAKL
eukprot:277886_1